MTISGANGTVGIEIDTVYRIALGHVPYPYQRALAETAQRNHWPDLVQIPTGLGKTAAIVLAWLYQHASRCAADIPAYRRLVWCLPMRVLVEQTADLAEKWIHSLHLAGVLQTRIPVYRLLGGQSCDDWDACPEQPAVLVGTQDQLLSRALNRGYGMSQYRWPMDFSLLHNDCLWIFDEV